MEIVIWGGLFGLQRNEDEGYKWHRKAAEKGNVEAQYSVGYCYLMGWGVEQSRREAARWYLRAAEKGMPQAQYNLGVLYAGGIDGPSDKEKALYWLQKADDQGFDLAIEQIWKLKYSTEEEK